MVRAAALAVFAITWIFRWLVIDFTNDHFAHLALGRQMLLGELPVRDFFDPGTPLLSFAAAVSLAASGQNLLGDAVLTITLVALGAALTFYVAARTSRSMLLALLAAFVAVVLFPRLYNYPKVFLYPLALVSVWYFVNRRTTVSLILLGVVTGIAAMLRLDHGLYIAIAVTVAVVLAHLDRLRMLPGAFARVAGAGAVLVLPFFVLVQLTAGIPSFLVDTRAQQASVASLHVLTVPFTATPGVLNPANAMAWLYYTTVFVPVVALVVLLIQWRRSRLEPAERITIATAIVLCLIVHQTLMRGSPDSRLPDVAGPTFALAAWVTATGVRAAQGRMRLVAGVAASLLWLATLWSATTFGETGERLIASGVPAGRQAVAERFRQVSQWMQMRPIDYYAPPGSSGVRGLTRYVLECTRPGDRVLAGSFEPQIFFFAERAFAGGLPLVKNGWHQSPEAQRLAVERMRRQRVPIVVINAATEAEVRGFSILYQYIQDNYREAWRGNFGGGPDYAILAKRDLPPRRTYPQFDLPCYR
jgi:hypothetical protein